MLLASVYAIRSAALCFAAVVSMDEARSSIKEIQRHPGPGAATAECSGPRQRPALHQLNPDVLNKVFAKLEPDALAIAGAFMQTACLVAQLYCGRLTHLLLGSTASSRKSLSSLLDCSTCLMQAVPAPRSAPPRRRSRCGSSTALRAGSIQTSTYGEQVQMTCPHVSLQLETACLSATSG